MPVYKITLGIGQWVMGATETYYSVDQSATVVAGRLQRLIDARRAMMTLDHYWTGVRIAQAESRRRSTFLLPGSTPFPGTLTYVNVPGLGVVQKTTIPSRPDQFRAVLQYLAFFDVDRVTTRYISGIPDAISGTEPVTVDLAGAGDWFTRFQSFATLLVADGWQIRARLRTENFVQTQVLGIVNSAVSPTEIGILIDATGAPTFTPGRKIALGKFRPKKGQKGPTLNGTWYVSRVDTGTYPGRVAIFLRNSESNLAANQNFTADSYIWNIGYSYYPINKAYYNRVGIHARGKPLGAPAGRRQTRPSLDA